AAMVASRSFRSPGCSQKDLARVTVTRDRFYRTCHRGALLSPDLLRVLSSDGALVMSQSDNATWPRVWRVRSASETRHIRGLLSRSPAFGPSPGEIAGCLAL